MKRKKYEADLKILKRETNIRRNKGIFFGKKKKE